MDIDPEKLTEEVTSLLLLKIQYDNQFEIIQKVVVEERWDQEERLIKSLERGKQIIDRMCNKYNEISNSR